MRKDLVLQRSQLRPRLESELPRQSKTRVLVRRKRVRLPSLAVQRQHQILDKPLPKRVLEHKPLELPDQRPRRDAFGELRGDPRLERQETTLLEPLSLPARERLIKEIGERRASPKLERPLQDAKRGSGIIGCRQFQTFLQEQFEPQEIDLTRRYDDCVARGSPLDSIGAEQASKSRNVRLERAFRRRRRSLPPQPFNQAITRDDLVRVQEQKREQSALLSAPERDPPSINEKLEPTENRELHNNEAKQFCNAVSTALQRASRNLGRTN